MDTSERIFQKLDGSWAVSYLISTHLPGHYDVNLRPATEHEILNMTQTPTQGLSGSNNSHSRLSPSGSKCWTECTASVKFLEENEARIFPLKVSSVIKLTPYLKSLPKDEVYEHEVRGMNLAQAVQEGRRSIDSLTPKERNDIWKTEGSIASREGTRAHDFAEAILNGRKTLEDIPEEFRPHLKTYIDHCNGLVPNGHAPYVEAKVPLFYSEDPEDTGTCDFCVVTDDRITVRDLKYGAGVLVEAEDNSQLAIYALSFVEDLMADGMFDFGPATIIDIGIVQPRHHAGAEIRTWVLTLSDLRHFCREVDYAAIQIRTGRGLKFEPSEDACRWCDAKAFCEARAKHLTEAFDTTDRSGIDFISMMPDLDKAESKLPVEERISLRTERAGGVVDTTDDKTLLAIWQATKGLKAFLDDVDEYINDRALSGDNFNGEVKLVAGREGNRAWANEEEADTFLRGQKLKESERYDFKLKGPAKIEVLLKEQLKKTRTANRFAELVSRSSGRPVAVPASDKRPAISAVVDLMPDIADEI